VAYAHSRAGLIMEVSSALLSLPLGRPARRWNDNISVERREIGWGDIDWIKLAQDTDWWRDTVKTIVHLWVLRNVGKFMSNSAIGGLAGQLQQVNVVREVILFRRGIRLQDRRDLETCTQSLELSEPFLCSVALLGGPCFCLLRIHIQRNLDISFPDISFSRIHR
jgi:hypothetical protein